MVRFLYNLILMSISGSIMYLLALLAKKVTKGRFSGWYYALSVTAAVLMIVPLQAAFTVPKIINIEVSQSFTQTVQSAETASAGTGISAAAVIFLIWLAAAAVSFSVTLARYIRAAKNLKAISAETYDEKILSAYSETRRLLGVSRDIKIMTSGALTSPLLFGIFKPAIVIPSRDFTYNELKMIFAHELTHYRHKDLAIKFTASIAASVHWFNPLSHFLMKSVNEWCELCCDESVLKRLDLSDKKDYGRLIISVIEHTPSRRFACTTAMASPKRGIQRRLLRIAEFKSTSRVFKTASAMAAVSMVVCSVTAFGFSEAKEIMPEPIAEFIDEATTEEAVTTPNTAAPTEPPQAAESSGGKIAAEYYQSTEELPPDAAAQTDDILSDPAENAETADSAAAAEAAEAVISSIEPNTHDYKNGVIDVATGSVSTGIDFTEKGQVLEMASVYSGSDNTTMSVYASSGSIEVVDAATNEIVYDGRESDEKTARIPTRDGQQYLVRVISDEDGESHADIYTYGVTDDDAE
ncbi:MAG: M56 family metallopeptidase [Firmicutes bacterium]|nr:M56 family metallopeptidase [Bacillota bacterium]